MDIPHIRTTSIIFSQRPLYMCYCPLWTMLSLPSSTLLTSAFCFRLTFAYTRAEPPEPCHWLICNRHSCHVKKLGPTLWFHHFLDKLWNVAETEKMEILNEDKVPLGNNKGATNGNVFKDMIRFT